MYIQHKGVNWCISKISMLSLQNKVLASRENLIFIKKKSFSLFQQRQLVTCLQSTTHSARKTNLYSVSVKVRGYATTQCMHSTRAVTARECNSPYQK